MHIIYELQNTIDWAYKIERPKTQYPLKLVSGYSACLACEGVYRKHHCQVV